MAWSAELEPKGAGGEPVDLWRTLASHGLADLPPQVLDEADLVLHLLAELPPDELLARLDGKPGS